MIYKVSDQINKQYEYIVSFVDTLRDEGEMYEDIEKNHIGNMIYFRITLLSFCKRIYPAGNFTGISVNKDISMFFKLFNKKKPSFQIIDWCCMAT